jgi:hypothetical protein
VVACENTATVHLTDAGGTPWCTEHATKLFTSLLNGKRALGLDMELPPVMELLRTG